MKDFAQGAFFKGLTEDLKRKEFFDFLFIIDGITVEMEKLRFIGTAGENNWLHFVNTKTFENHLCSPEQFPRYKIKGREKTLEFVYQ